MIKIFFDSSALIAASASKEGGSAYIMALCRSNRVQGFISEFVIKEVSRNIVKKFGPEVYKRFLFYLKNCNLLIVGKDSIPKTSINLTDVNDVPILSAAISSGCDFLITLDRKHLLERSVIGEAREIGLQVVSPGDFISIFRKFQPESLRNMGK